MTVYDEIVMATEPHDQIGLAAVVIMLIASLAFPKYAMWLIIVSIVIVVAVFVDLTAHGWDH